jgi:hypothetical protein
MGGLTHIRLGSNIFQQINVLASSVGILDLSYSSVSVTSEGSYSLPLA